MNPFVVKFGQTTRNSNSPPPGFYANGDQNSENYFLDDSNDSNNAWPRMDTTTAAAGIEAQEDNHHVILIEQKQNPPSLHDPPRRSPRNIIASSSTHGSSNGGTTSAAAATTTTRRNSSGSRRSSAEQTLEEEYEDFRGNDEDGSDYDCDDDDDDDDDVDSRSGSSSNGEGIVSATAASNRLKRKRLRPGGPHEHDDDRTSNSSSSSSSNAPRRSTIDSGLEVDQKRVKRLMQIDQEVANGDPELEMALKASLDSDPRSGANIYSNGDNTSSHSRSNNSKRVWAEHGDGRSAAINTGTETYVAPSNAMLTLDQQLQKYSAAKNSDDEYGSTAMLNVMGSQDEEEVETTKESRHKACNVFAGQRVGRIDMSQEEEGDSQRTTTGAAEAGVGVGVGPALPIHNNLLREQQQREQEDGTRGSHTIDLNSPDNNESQSNRIAGTSKKFELHNDVPTDLLSEDGSDIHVDVMVGTSTGSSSSNLNDSSGSHSRTENKDCNSKTTPTDRQINNQNVPSSHHEQQEHSTSVVQQTLAVAAAGTGTQEEDMAMHSASNIANINSSSHGETDARKDRIDYRTAGQQQPATGGGTANSSNHTVSALLRQNHTSSLYAETTKASNYDDINISNHDNNDSYGRVPGAVAGATTTGSNAASPSDSEDAILTTTNPDTGINTSSMATTIDLT
mmetsp:Transcript_7093/g.11939  ORF Transcript_7093/g.11939 Transcript_7093/m.11939 type:complete len:678 (+) Transcript_7093:804-2837(+)